MGSRAHLQCLCVDAGLQHRHVHSVAPPQLRAVHAASAAAPLRIRLGHPPGAHRMRNALQRGRLLAQQRLPRRRKALRRSRMPVASQDRPPLKLQLPIPHACSFTAPPSPEEGLRGVYSD